MGLTLLTILIAIWVVLVIYSVTWMPEHQSKWDNAIGFVVVSATVLMVLHILFKIAGVY
jgi:hypothetical protein